MLKPGVYQATHENGMFDSYKITMEVKETDKSYIFKLIEFISRYSATQIEDFFAKSKRVVIRKDKGGHVVRVWSDDNFTFYPYQAGVPFFLNKMKERGVNYGTTVP